MTLARFTRSDFDALNDQLVDLSDAARLAVMQSWLRERGASTVVSQAFRPRQAWWADAILPGLGAFGEGNTPIAALTNAVYQLLSAG